MIKNAVRALRTTALIAVTGVSLAVAPANAATAPAWETLSQPIDQKTASILPFDAQNAFARTFQQGCDDCNSSTKLWQRTGTTWKQLTPPADAALGVQAGTGPGDLWTMGRKSSGAFQTNHYDGTTWSGNLSPGQNLDVFDAKAVSHTSVWGVGQTRSDTTTGWYPTVTHWDGTAWKTTKFTQFDGMLSGLSVRSDSDIWAVGNKNTGSQTQGLALHYDGTAWTEVPVPATVNAKTFLDTVHSNGPNDVWVAGRALNDKQQTVTKGAYVIHWDGTKWTHRDLPSTEGWVSTFATYDGKVYAGGTFTPKLLRWTGTAWETVTGFDSSIAYVSSLKTTADGSLYLSGYWSSFFGSLYYQQRLAAPAAR